MIPVLVSRRAIVHGFVSFRGMILGGTTVAAVAGLMSLSASHPGLEGEAFAAPGNTTLRVAAAVSLRPVVLALKPSFEKANAGTILEVNFGSSGQLRAQIAQGAPVDVFLAADQEDAKALAKAGFAAESALRKLAQGRMVVVVPSSLDPTLDGAFTRDGLAALKAAGVRKIATGTPASVPLGRYALEALRKAALEGEIKNKLVFAENARQALTYVERADAQAALVYASDARTSKNVKVVWDVPADWHPPITYVGMAVKGTHLAAQADALLALLTSDEGRNVFRAAGFTP